MKISAALLLIVTSARADCGVYLAPSTIPGAGLGLYAGKDYGKGDRVTWGDLIFPVIELSWNNGHEDFFWLWDEYTWSYTVEESMEFETDGSSDLSAASPGIGAALNCMLGLVNIEDTVSKCESGGLHRSKDPGAGAITPYHDRASVATRDISAGGELFIDYGSKYFESRKSIYGLLPLHKNHEEANPIMYRFHRLQSEVLKYYSESLQNDLWTIITGLNTRTTNALPPKAEDINDDLLRKGTAFVYEGRSHGSVEWLEEHGQCADNIRNGPSTIPQAGRGAFATRFIPSGGLVAPAPLIHISNKTQLDMYEALPPKDGFIRRNLSAPVHQQLLLNYCFGHPDSDVLVSPYGVLVNLINHSPTRANTKIVWSNQMRHAEWLKMSPKVMEKDHHSGLSFDYVALRNIEEDEEIFIDYGPDWQTAWDDHVAGWKPPPDADKYEPAYERNGINQTDSILPTSAEGGYGADVKLWVHGAYINIAGHETRTEYTRAEIMDRFTTPNGEIRYRAQTFREKDRKYTTKIEYGIVLWSLPRDAFVFDDVPYTRDHIMPWSFRHYIGIPDEIFPEAWKRDNMSFDFLQDIFAAVETTSSKM